MYLHKRSSILIRAEILRILYDGPTGPTKLSRLCNIPYDRLESYVLPLIERGLVLRNDEEGKIVYSLSEEGAKVLLEIERILSKLKP